MCAVVCYCLLLCDDCGLLSFQVVCGCRWLSLLFAGCCSLSCADVRCLLGMVVYCVLWFVVRVLSVAHYVLFVVCWLMCLLIVCRSMFNAVLVLGVDCRVLSAVVC